ncbi:hypothetical protein N7G274_009125 [Stereocaulon virgatum]|uniref:Uncharacterized protein n=1 Tax=Stereocaulon virgatum TaxID=373712 RepID=A0ABR4A1F2_9LECA
MNWTGGNLSRSRNANASITAKQKNHFAKVRAKLQNVRSFTPTNLTFNFGDWQPKYAARKRESSPLASIKQYGQSREQTILDNFESTRPLVRRLESLKPRNNKRKHAPVKQEHSISQTMPERHHKNRPNSPILISSRPPSSSSSSQYSHKATFTQVRASSSPEVPDHTSIEAKRRRLLQMRDWVGVECKYSKPVHMQFTDAKDKDMIGRRRQVKMPSFRLQSTYNEIFRKEKHLDGRRGVASPDQGFSQGQMSIWIGSTAGKSACTQASDEMLFDSEADEAAQLWSPAIPTIKAGALTSSSVFDHGQYEIQRPSPYMEHISSSSSAFAPLPHEHPYQSQRTAHSVDDENAFESVPQIGEPEIELTYEKPEPASEEPTFRLVFENTPQPYAQFSEDRTSSPVVRHVGLSRAQVPEAPHKKPVSSKGHDVEMTGTHRDTYNPLSGRLVHSTPPVVMVTARNTAKLQDHGLKIGRYDKATSSRFCDDMAWPAKHKERDMESETLQASPITTGLGISAQREYPGQKDPQSEEESMWRHFTMLDDMEETSSIQVRPISHGTPKHSATASALHLAASPAQPQKEPSKAAEDEEEQIWRNFIFSDDDHNNEWTIEEPQVSTQSQSPYNPTRTQPSMIAEAATSPIKQNPHMDMLKASSDKPTCSPKVSSRHPGALYSISIERHLTTSSDLAGPTPDIEDSAKLQDRVTFSPNPSDIDSVLIEASPTKKKLPIPSSPKPPPHKDKLSALIAQATSLLPKLPPQKQNPPSLIAEASSDSMRISSNPMNVSSDELQWSPTRAPLIASKTVAPKVVFTPPKRYVGGRAADATESVALGRVLRNGTRVGRRKEARGRRGKVNARAEIEDHEDDIEDD